MALGFVLFAAASSAPAAAQPGIITQGFRGSTTLPTGALVSLSENSEDTIVPSTTSLAQRLVGAVNDQAFLELSDTNSTVQVVVDGTAPALVSDLNGTVHKGDYVTASPVAGVGMRATESSVIVGIAQADLADATDTTQRTINDRNGQTRTINIGLVPIHINVAVYTAPESNQKRGVSSTLQNLASSIAGRPISSARAILATAITVLLFTIIVVVLYAAVRSSVISIGRNPLSERSLRKSMVQIGLMVLGIAIAGFGIVYAILRI